MAGPVPRAGDAEDGTLVIPKEIDPAPVVKSFAARASPELLLLALVLFVVGLALVFVGVKLGDLAAETRSTRVILETLLTHVDGWR